MSRQEIRSRIAVIAVILGIFFAFAGEGIGGYFAPDEMMNLYNAWFPPLGQLLSNGRPLGALVYRILFAIFGLNPVPYRVFCFMLVLANLILLYRFCKLASGSREVAVLACVIGAYHAHLADLYYASATLFDLLCFFFFFAALTYYMAIRRGARQLTWPQAATVLLLYACALESKEMAVTLPVLVVLYDLIYGKRKASLAGFSDWWRRSRFLWISIPVTFAFVAYKTTGAHPMTLNPEYHPHFSARVFLAAWRHYLPDLFYGTIRFNDLRIVALWVFLLAFAAIVRRRDLIFAWSIAFFGALPFVFIAPRGFFAMYMTLPGWYLYAAVLLLLLRQQAMRGLPQIAAFFGVRPEQLALLAAVVAVAIPLHLREKPLGNAWVPGAFAETRPVLEQLASRYPKMPPRAKVLFLSDPCPPNDYILYFMLALQYRDREIRVDRAKSDPTLASAAARSHYNYVFIWGPNGLEEAPR